MLLQKCSEDRLILFELINKRNCFMRTIETIGKVGFCLYF